MTLLILFVIATTCMQTYLILRQASFLKKNQTIPKPFEHVIKISEYQKALAYNLAKLYFSLIKYWVINLFILGLIYGNFLESLLIIWHNIFTNPILSNAALLLSVLIIYQLINLPLTYYQIFIIERRFGFNTTPFVVFILDFIKKIALLGAISAPILAATCWLLIHSSFWWLWLWGIGVIVGGIITLISPLITSRLFYQHIPLTDAKLITSIHHLLTSYNFSINKVFIINSSTRTQHSNAHLLGFGSLKRILLSDTLIKNFSNEEITAIIAHELGHYYHKHILKHFMITALMSLTGFIILNGILQHAEIAIASNIIFLANLLLLFPLLSFWIQPLMCKITRYYEFEADQFASDKGHNAFLQQALVKLYSKNASVLKSDSWFCAWFYTHPPPMLRLSRMS